ncbi:MAG: hypothetical protein DRJ13_07390 [Bacteroidetes bacterium]|nr:MAG: hypothetical protein DRJ13_07390 [Bacteroidota bacterium]
MKIHNFSILILMLLIAGLALAGCTPSGPCQFTGNIPLTAFSLPDLSSDVFGTLPAGETRSVLAWTANGWIGFDPGIAQAGNIGLAHHRWVYLNGVVTPSCLAGVDQVTLADVQADLAASSP